MSDVDLGSIRVNIDIDQQALDEEQDTVSDFHNPSKPEDYTKLTRNEAKEIGGLLFLAWLRANSPDEYWELQRMAAGGGDTDDEAAMDAFLEAEAQGPLAVEAQEGGAQEGEAEGDIHFVDELEYNDKTDDERYTKDTLDVNERVIKNGEFVLEPRQSISKDRPEIISTFIYKPIWVGDPKRRNLSAFGRLVEIQHQASYLRRDLLQEILLDAGLQAQLAKAQEGVGRGQFVNLFTNLKQTSGAYIENSRKIIERLRTMSGRIDDIQNKFDLKRIPSRFFEDNSNFSLREFYTNYMDYTGEQFDRFSNTKIYFQFLRDFRTVAENYSFSLLDLSDADRRVDQSPINIDTTYTLSDGFNFRISQLRSKGKSRNMTVRNNFNRFIESLPVDPKDRIKLLITVFTKEYRVSKALGSDKKLNKTLQNAFDYEPDVGAHGDITSPNPFDNIFGATGKNIFDPPKGVSEKSLMNLGQIVSGKSPTGVQEYDYIVLPFEEKYVDSVPATVIKEKVVSQVKVNPSRPDPNNTLRDTIDVTEREKVKINRSFVPGKSYFVDSIMDLKTVKQKVEQVASETSPGSGGTVIQSGPTTFNTTPLQKYADIFAKKQSEASLAIERLFELNTDSTLGPHAAYTFFANSLQNSYKDLTDRATASEEQAITAALFKFSNQDKILKHFLFQFELLAGLDSNTEHNENVIWADLARELVDVKAFGSIQQDEVDRAGTATKTNLLDANENFRLSVKPYMRQIADKIQRRIQNKVNTLSPRIRTDGRFYRAIEQNTIKEVLMKAPISTSSNLVKVFLSAATVYRWLSFVNNENAPLLDDGSGRTRYNFMSISTQLLLLFEILCSFADISSPAFFVANEDRSGTKHLGYQVKWRDAKRIRYAFQDTITQKIINPQDFLSISPRKFIKLQKQQAAEVAKGTTDMPEINFRTDKRAQQFRKRFENIRIKVIKEDLYLANAVYITEIITKRLQVAKNIAEKQFNKETYETLSEALRKVRITKEDDIQDRLFMIRERSQLRTCTYISDQFNRKISDAVDFKNQNKIKIFKGQRDDTVVTTELVHKNVKEAVYALLSKSKFRKGFFIEPRLKIFSIGIPAGFAEKLVHRVEFSKIGRKSFQEKQTDVITIRVHKKNLRFEDIIFKPQIFLFDLSLFQRDKELINTNLKAGSHFNKYFQANQLIDYDKISDKVAYAVRPETAGGGQPLYEEEKYRFLSQFEKARMFKNTMESYLLGTFIGIATGLRINEAAYNTQNSKTGSLVEQDFEAFFLKYIERRFNVKLPAGKNIHQLLASKRVRGGIKNYLRMIDSAGLAFSLEKIRRNVLDPKLFDRVFHVAVNSDGYEIDVTGTGKTKSGKQALKQLAVARRIQPRKVGGRDAWFFIQQSKEDILFEDYWVVVKNKR